MKAKIFLVVFSIALLSSCATTPQWKLKDKSSATINPSQASEDSFSEQEENLKTVDLAESQTLSNLYRKLLQRMPDTEDSPILRGLMAKAERSSLEEAVLGLYVLQAFVDQEAAHERLLAMGESSDFKAEAFLARLCAFANIDLIQLIQENNFLQTMESYKLLAKINSSKNKETRQTHLARAIEEKFVKLHDFALLNNPLTAGTYTEEGESNRSEEASAHKAEGEKVEDEKDSSAAIIEQVDSLLASNKFFEAINLLKEIDENEELYDVAQEKVGKISTKAVNDLRKKAATYFRQANQLHTDIKAREVYLAQAKTTLQVALDLYPKAEQVGRVKKDLKIIDDNLRFLKKGRLEKR